MRINQMDLLYIKPYGHSPVRKIAKNAVCRSVYLTTWHCILSAELTNAELTN